MQSFWQVQKRSHMPERGWSDSNSSYRLWRLLTDTFALQTIRRTVVETVVLARAVFTFEGEVDVQAPQVVVAVQRVESGVVGRGFGWKGEGGDMRKQKGEDGQEGLRVRVSRELSGEDWPPGDSMVT